MSAGRNLALMALIAGAYASNPDENSFRHHLERELRSRDNSWVESKITAYLTAQSVTRDNYYLFSVVKMPSEGTFVGLFGNWIRMPTARH